MQGMFIARLCHRALLLAGTTLDDSRTYYRRIVTFGAAGKVEFWRDKTDLPRHWSRDRSNCAAWDLPFAVQAFPSWQDEDRSIRTQSKELLIHESEGSSRQCWRTEIDTDIRLAHVIGGNLVLSYLTGRIHPPQPS